MIQDYSKPGEVPNLLNKIGESLLVVPLQHNIHISLILTFEMCDVALNGSLNLFSSSNKCRNIQH
jgi:hypothetical protein